jgi:hypothetical protein
MHDMRLMASWVLALFLAAMFLWIADLTLFPPEPERNVIFPLLADYSGVTLFEPTGRLVTGLLQVLAALLLLLPWTRRVGAVLALAVAGGAVASHVLWLGQEVPVALGSDETDGGQLLYLAVGLTAAALALVFVHPGRRSQAG